MARAPGSLVIVGAAVALLLTGARAAADIGPMPTESPIRTAPGNPPLTAGALVPQALLTPGALVSAPLGTGRGGDVALAEPGEAAREHGEATPPDIGGRIVALDPRTRTIRTLVLCVAPCAAVDRPMWSPDRRRLAFRVSARTERGGLVGWIAILDQRGGIRRVLLDDLTSWQWAPDSSRLVAADYRRVWLIRAEDGSYRQLRWSGPRAIDPVWSPDGREVAFVVPRDGRRHRKLVLQALPGAPRVIDRSSDPAKSAGDLTWSPAGDRIALETGDGTSIVTLAGKDVATHLRGFGPAWAPDGARLALLRRDLRSVLLVGADGRNHRRIALPARTRFGLFWSARGHRLIADTVRGWFAIDADRGDTHRINVAETARLFQAAPALRTVGAAGPPSYDGP